MAKSELLIMSDTIIYKPNWHYDFWTDIETYFPKGSEVSAIITTVRRDYAFLSTSEGIYCFLDKRNIKSLGVINDLTQEIKQGDSKECIVLDYNQEKKSLIVSLKLN